MYARAKKEQDMVTTSKIALSAAIVLCAAVPALAATKTHASRGPQASHYVGTGDSGVCGAAGGPPCSDACPTNGQPCRINSNSW
jgi:hypothetical protein